MTTEFYFKVFLILFNILSEINIFGISVFSTWIEKTLFQEIVMSADREYLSTESLDWHDSITSLPLSAFNLENSTLRSATLRKNIALETVIDFTNSVQQDIGLITQKELMLHFDRDEVGDSDKKTLSSLTSLPSFDCYTLKAALAPLKIKVLDEKVFNLSSKMKTTLFPLMSRITRPLIQYLYSDQKFGVSDTETLLRLIKDTEPLKVRNRLEIMAQNMSVPLSKLIEILEEFGELFLSVSFFERINIEASSKIDQLILWAEDGVSNSNLRNDPSAQSQFSQIERRLGYIKTNLHNRFDNLGKITQIDWEEFDASDFKKVKREILSQQANLSIALCGILVKAFEWEKQFPSAGGSPQQCLEFISQDLNIGLEYLTRALPEVE